jgi:hypothetical protein
MGPMNFPSELSGLYTVPLFIGIAIAVSGTMVAALMLSSSALA